MPASVRKHIKKFADSRYMTANVIIMSQGNNTITSALLSQSCQRTLLAHYSKTSFSISIKALKLPCLSKNSIESIFMLLTCPRLAS